MVVSSKNGDIWRNLEGYNSRLSCPPFKSYYMVNGYWHRLYGRTIGESWDLNNKYFKKFKGV